MTFPQDVATMLHVSQGHITVSAPLLPPSCHTLGENHRAVGTRPARVKA